MGNPNTDNLLFMEFMLGGRSPYEQRLERREIYPSLDEQFKRLQQTLSARGIHIKSLAEFVERCLPPMEGTFHISMPAFDRRIDNEGRYPRIRNVVIRPERTVIHNSCLPPDTEVLFIGDVEYRPGANIFAVRGIELIDSSVARFGEFPICCTPRTAIGNARRVSGVYASVFGGFPVGTLANSALTHDLLLRLAAELKAIPEPEKAAGLFEEWERYIRFREYYLEQQKNKSIPVYDAFVTAAYQINRRDYQEHIDELEEQLLGGFANSVQSDKAVLETEPEFCESEALSLAAAVFRINKHEAMKNTVRRRDGKEVPAFRSSILSFTRSFVSLAEAFDDDDWDDGRQGRELTFDERFMFGERELTPDCSELKKAFDAEKTEVTKSISDKWNTLKETRLTELRDERRAEMETALKTERERLAEELAAKVGEQKIKGIPAVEDKYRADINKVKKEIDAANKKRRASLSNKLNKLRNEQKAAQKRLANLKKRGKDTSQAEEERILANIEDRKREIAEATEQLEQIKTEAQRELEIRTADISLDNYYKQYLEDLTEQEFNRKRRENEALLMNYVLEKSSEFDAEHRGEIRSELDGAAADIDARRKEAEDRKNREETTLEYVVYFKLDSGVTTDEAEKFLKRDTPKIIKYNTRAESAKLSRQKNALASLKAGYVKNPFIASYLFCPSALKEVEIPSPENISWYLDCLNDKQKDAVCRALSSDSLFLLQGPPGTGKTQVIAELSAQLARRGKRVLISSETHKAIDNVFDRLPKIPQIRPVRLINTAVKKKNDYSIEDLVDNFFLNLSDGLKKQIGKFNSFRELRDSFDERMKALEGLHRKMLSLELEHGEITRKKERVSAEIAEKEEELSALDYSLSENSEKLRDAQGFKRSLKEFRVSDRDIEWSGEFKSSLQSYRLALENLLREYPVFVYDVSNARRIFAFSPDNARRELELMGEGNPELARLQGEQARLKQQMSQLRDPDTDEPLPQFEQEHSALQNRFVSVGRQIKALREGAGAQLNLDGFKLSGIVMKNVLADENERRRIPEALIGFQSAAAELIEKHTANANDQIKSIEQEKDGLLSRKSSVKVTIKALYDELTELDGNPAFSEYKSAERSLRTKIRAFFTDFDIHREPSDIRESLEIIREEWNRLGEYYGQQKDENDAAIPMYQHITDFLSKEPDEEERMEYTRLLFENANIFGMTCTSASRFRSEKLEGAVKYGIGDLNIHHLGIDVVIVDEVSKSSFPDLLIPVLYGKTVILVGDHRQLPPMYDLKHLSCDDFDGLDPEYISEPVNKVYTEMVETCVFKRLFEQIPGCYKIMLDKQYRCHSDIMDVFNHFYGEKGLSVGLANQNDEKQHGLTVSVGGKTVIDPSKHIYFVNCDRHESRAEGSSSAYNEQEASAVTRLIGLINEACGERNLQCSRDAGEGKIPPLSAGVICTYGDQAALVKRKLKAAKLTNPKNFSAQPGERFVVSTVDDFQGDERDIIIVSMVRNPDGRHRGAQFLQQFERINVAFSRARTMLIIVGNEEYLSLNTIELPDINGDTALDRHSYPIYRHIIDTVREKGRVLSAALILGKEDLK